MHIFFHIPKAAGTNFTKKLTESIGVCNTLNIVRPIDLAFMSDETINSKGFLSGHFGWAILNRIKPDVKKYTILRNPISRIISQYKYMVRLTQAGLLNKSAMIGFINKNNRISASKDGLKEILLNKEIPYIEGAFRNTATWTFVSDANVSARWESDDKNVLEISKAHLLCLDFIGLVEEMEMTFNLLSAQLGKTIKNDSRANNSDNIDFEVDDELIEIIIENNLLDIELYRWAKRLFYEHYQSTVGGKPLFLIPNDFSGSGWKNGIRTDGVSNMFYFLAPRISELCISPGDAIEFAQSGQARVVRVEPSQQNGVISVYITVDIPIDPVGDGFPNKVFVTSNLIRPL